MNDKAIRILDGNRIMAISTVRPDGWPQTTIVGYANEGLTVYFVIFRSSQKFANIALDNRVSLAVGREPPSIEMAQAVYAGAVASELIDDSDIEQAWRKLEQRHPNLVGMDVPDRSIAAIMKAECRHVSVLDYSQGVGHADALHIETAGKAERS